MNTTLIVIWVIGMIIAYSIGAYYGEKTGSNIQETQNIWDELARSGEICHNCANAGVSVCENCGHHSWDSIYADIKKRGGY
jgi:hypothetical protein